MPFKLLFTEEAKNSLNRLKSSPNYSKRLKAIRKTIALLETNLRHPSLNTHKYSAIQGKNGEDVFEAYAENKTPAAFRVFWHYGPKRNELTIIAITSHP